MKAQFSFEAIGTWWEIDIEGTVDTLQSAVKDYLETFDRLYSRFISTSLVSTFAEKPGVYDFPEEGMEMLRIYKDLYFLTEGLFTPLIGQTLSDAGYDATYSFKEKPLHSPLPFEKTIKILPNNQIETTDKIILDLGGIGKGYAIDKVSKIIGKHDIHSYTINAGGDIFYKNKNNVSLRVGMENPIETKQVVGIINIETNKSICSSAGNRRKWGNYHHILNPHTLTSPSDVLAVWTIAETATMADALATCLFLVKPGELIKKYQFEYFILYPDFSFTKSDGFKAELFT